jgi:hypothetical protein
MSSHIPVADLRATPVAIAPSRSMLWMLGTVIPCALAYYLIGFEQGASALFNGAYVHELVHDARHFIGFPCH